MLNDGTVRIINAWGTRKDADVDSHVKTPSLPVQPQPQQPVLNDSDPLEFCVHVEPGGNVIRIGSLYTLGFSGNSVFLCSSISRHADQFTFKFVLCSFVNEKVDNLHDGILQLSLN